MLPPDESPIAPLSFKTKTLENAELGMQYVMSTAAFELETMPGEFWQDRLVARMRAYVLRDHIATDHYDDQIELPTTWWQMWKRDHAPAWFLRRFPVDYWTRTVRVQVDRYLMYPDAAIRMPDMGRAVIYEETSPLNRSTIR